MKARICHHLLPGHFSLLRLHLQSSLTTFKKQLLKPFFFIYGNFLLSFLLSNLQYDYMFGASC